MSCECGSVFCNECRVSVTTGLIEKRNTHGAGLVSQDLGHPFRVECKELRLDDQIARVLELQRTLQVLLWDSPKRVWQGRAEEHTVICCA